MAATFIKFTQTSTHGRYVQQSLTQLHNGRRTMADLLASLATMLTGDGTLDSHYGMVQTALGCDTTADAHALYLELLTLNQAMTVDTSVTNVNKAFEQVFAKMFQ